MTYEPLALKYRPRRFSDLVGQDPVADTLRNALAAGRVANAFLFAGSRGVGKTSCARILAKALNCPHSGGGEPCGTCEVCLSIAAGDDMDVIEIDGASNRGIDEIRTIRDNAGYKPGRGPYKVYIIDEVHMLTIQAFNALLKTLEEPPPHVRFIFATTQVQAVPETIVSRCQRFEFRRIRQDDITARLADICSAEGVEIEDGVLQEIAIKAEGGLRDSIGLLDQAVSFAGGGRVGLEDLQRVLGRMDGQLLGELLAAAGEGRTDGVLDALDTAFESGRDPEDVLAQIVEVLREAMLQEARGAEGAGPRGQLAASVRRLFPMDRLLLALRVALNTRREMKLAGQGRVQLELALMRIARSGDLLPVEEILKRLEGGEGGAAPPERGGRPAWRPPSASGPPGKPASEPAGKPTPGPAAPDPSGKGGPGETRSRVPGGDPPSLGRVQGEWPRVLEALKGRSRRAAAVLGESRPVRITGSRLEVELPAGQGFARSQVQGELAGLVDQVVLEVLGHPLELVWTREGPSGGEAGPEQRRTAPSVYEDPGVRKVMDSFDGGLISIENEDGT